jgi:glutamate dehydrogenase
VPEDSPDRRDVFEALSTGQPSPLLQAFAEAVLRRAPDELFATVPPKVIAERLRAAFTTVDARNGDELAIRVRRDGDATVLEVVSDDRPFLLSTLQAELASRDILVRWSLHPIIGIRRDPDGAITAIGPARHADSRVSVVHLEVVHLPAEGDQELIETLRALLKLLRTVTDDHHAMQSRIELAAAQLRTSAAEHPDPHDALEVAALLDWTLDDNVVLLGILELRPPNPSPLPETSSGAEAVAGLLADPATALGLLRGDPPELVAPLSWPPSDGERTPGHPELLAVTRTRVRSPIQRRDRMEVLAVNLTGDDGTPYAQLRIYGLFTRKALSEPVRDVPVIRRRLADILDLEDIVDGSHDAIAITSLLQALPKDEVLRTPSAELHRTSVGLLHAEARHELVAHVRHDRDSQTAAVIISVPGDRWDAELRRLVVDELSDRFTTGEHDVDVALHEHAIVRVLLHHVSAPTDETAAARTPAAVTATLRRLARSWADASAEVLGARIEPSVAARLQRDLLPRLPRSYRDRTAPADAPADLLLLDHVLSGPSPLLVAFRVTGSDASGDHARLLAAKRDDPLELSAFLPIVESLGLTVVDELPHELHGDDPKLTLHDFGVRAASVDVHTDGPRLADAIQAAWRGHLEIDPMNHLVLEAGLDWRDVSILRAYRRLRRQIGTAYTPAYIDSALAAHPAVVRSLVDHIHARFEPGRSGSESGRLLARGQVVEGLDAIRRLDHDRILRGILELIDATLRTNAFRADAVADITGEPYVAFKIDPSRVADIPAPVPYREIFVHSPRVEGVHLRAGAVARGGLRWSDRRDDVRTEVLDLVKAQVLKNAVIVPTGAKGGFVVTNEPADPDELREEVRRQYVTFVRGLLDVTDDLDGDRVVPPPDVVRHDGDDPYLVVAADRGTATFSDTANGVAARYGYWLDDAFASGGSQGYDHKALGVTARGAWVAVTRHFRELGLDVASEPIRVAGVGDMSGDVFGNGLLQSRAVRLVAAFDHRHIFLDPDPDPAVSYAERERLFSLARSSWDDYDRRAMGPGGIVASRDAKHIELTDEIRAALRIEDAALSPPELIQAILRAPIDLLFAGGIGTYIKASTERHEDLGDRGNDELRVDATEVRARVLGEGANLFITQRARIELARRGAHLNQDAVDNAAGVATSDLEVNIKILLRMAEDDRLIDRAERDVILTDLADDVVAAALRTVDRQANAISRESVRCAGLLHAYLPLLARLERDAELDRGVEVLPSNKEIRARMAAGAGFSRPELATMVAWAKRQLKEALLGSDVPDSPLSRHAIHRAFPPALVARFPELPPRHRLRRELIATQLANAVVDRMGVSFVDHLTEETGAPLAEVVRAFQAARVGIDADRWWDHLDGLDEVQDPARIRELEAPLEDLLATLTRTLLSDPSTESAEQRSEVLVVVARTMLDDWSTIGTEDQRRARRTHARRLVDDLVDADLARLLASARELSLIPDVAAVHAEVVGTELTSVADALLQLGDALGIDRLEQCLRRIVPTEPWSRRQRLGLAADLRRVRCQATITAHREHAGEDSGQVVAGYLEPRRAAVDRALGVVTAAERAEGSSLDALGVAVRAITETVHLGHVAS